METALWMLFWAVAGAVVIFIATGGPIYLLEIRHIKKVLRKYDNEEREG